MTVEIHETAIVDKGAKVGEGTRIWHWAHICAGAVIGQRCSMGQNVFIGNRVTMGDDVKIQNNVSVYDDVTLEDGVFCGPSMVFTNVYNPRSYVNRKSEYMQTIVREGATLGANCTIVCGVEIGKYSFIGAGTVVIKDVKDYALMVGNPGRQVGWMSRFGTKLDLPLSGNKTATCTDTGEIYQLDGSTCKLIED